jgi:hypothetical protein
MSQEDKRVTPFDADEWRGDAAEFWAGDYMRVLVNMVSAAEAARVKNDHEMVEEIWQAWVGGEKYKDLEADIRDKFGLDKIAEREGDNPLGQFAVAMVGLARIGEVNANKQLPGKSGEGLLQYQARYDQVISEVKGIYNHYEVFEGKLPSFTIDGNQISWIAEITQDKIRRLELKGQYDEAVKTARELDDNLEKLANNGDVSLADVSAWSVARWRLAKVTNDLSLMTSALSISNRVHRQNRNFQRMFDLGKMSLKYLRDNRSRLELNQIRPVLWRAGVGVVVGGVGVVVGKAGQLIY